MWNRRDPLPDLIYLPLSPASFLPFLLAWWEEIKTNKFKRAIPQYLNSRQWSKLRASAKHLCTGESVSLHIIGAPNLRMVHGNANSQGRFSSGPEPTPDTETDPSNEGRLNSTHKRQAVFQHYFKMGRTSPLPFPCQNRRAGVVIWHLLTSKFCVKKLNTA